mgnify:CR=1 FL=1
MAVITTEFLFVNALAGILWGLILFLISRKQKQSNPKSHDTKTKAKI